MRDILPEIRRRGAELIVIGNGLPMHALDFLEHYPIDAKLLLDTELKAYAAAGLRRDAKSLLSLSLLKNGVRALKGGFRQGAAQGDPWQMGGVFVVDKGGDIRFRHVSKTAGDHPTSRQLLQALD